MEDLADAAVHSVELVHVQEEERARSLQEEVDSQDIAPVGNVLVEEVAGQQVTAADNYIAAGLLDRQDLVVVHVLHKALVVVHFDLVDHLRLGVDLRSQRRVQKQARMQLEN